MKKIIFLTIVAAFMLNISALEASEPKKKKSADKEKVQDANEQQKLSDEEVQKMVARIDEINSMDKKALTPKERRALRKEVRDIKDMVNKNAEGIYIGGGALLVVIVLLILLL
jgi:Na+-transporting methylmalonyl-CoA/oxaloacetate decarboxylase gamma subunit